MPGAQPGNAGPGCMGDKERDLKVESKELNLGQVNFTSLGFSFLLCKMLTLIGT